MKFSEEELTKIIQEELERVDEIFNIPFGKSSKSTNRKKSTKRGLSKEMEYDDFLDGLNKKGQDVFDSAASYSDMKDAKQDKQLDKMLKQHRDMLMKIYDKIMNDLNDLQAGLDPKSTGGVDDGGALPGSTPDAKNAIRAAVSGLGIPGRNKATSAATGKKLAERKNRRRKRTK